MCGEPDRRKFKKTLKSLPNKTVTWRAESAQCHPERQRRISPELGRDSSAYGLTACRCSSRTWAARAPCCSVPVSACASRAFSGDLLNGADLSDANLSDAIIGNLVGTDLSGADLSRADLADLRNADLAGARTSPAPTCSSRTSPAPPDRREPRGRQDLRPGRVSRRVAVGRVQVPHRAGANAHRSGGEPSLRHARRGRPAGCESERRGPVRREPHQRRPDRCEPGGCRSVVRTSARCNDFRRGSRQRHAVSGTDLFARGLSGPPARDHVALLAARVHNISWAPAWSCG